MNRRRRLFRSCCASWRARGPRWRSSPRWRPSCRGSPRRLSHGGLPDLQRYIYYAPLGAVVTAHPTLLASLRTARSSVLSVGLGAALGLVVLTVLGRGPLSLAAAIGGGEALGSLPRLGSERSWVPIVALFVLVIGGQTELGDYAMAYVGLVALGAFCGVAVNLLLPTLRCSAGEEALARLKTVLADQLAGSADRLQRLQRSLERVSSLVDDLPELRLAAHQADGSPTARPAGRDTLCPCAT